MSRMRSALTPLDTPARRSGESCRLLHGPDGEPARRLAMASRSEGSCGAWIPPLPNLLELTGQRRSESRSRLRAGAGGPAAARKAASSWVRVHASPTGVCTGVSDVPSASNATTRASANPRQLERRDALLIARSHEVRPGACRRVRDFHAAVEEHVRGLGAAVTKALWARGWRGRCRRARRSATSWVAETIDLPPDALAVSYW